MSCIPLVWLTPRARSTSKLEGSASLALTMEAIACNSSQTKESITFMMNRVHESEPAMITISGTKTQHCSSQHASNVGALEEYNIFSFGISRREHKDNDILVYRHRSQHV